MGLKAPATRYLVGLNESPYEKVGKFNVTSNWTAEQQGLNESPYEKVGKWHYASSIRMQPTRLNESPYEKVGKSW